MAEKRFDVLSEALRSASVSIQTEQDTLTRSTQGFATGARQLSTAQGYLDAYNDAIRDVMRATEDAIVAFGALATNLAERAGSLRITANNYDGVQDAATQGYNGLSGGS